MKSFILKQSPVLFYLGALLFLQPAFGQEDPEIPNGPLLEKAKDSMQWTIQFSYAEVPVPATEPGVPKNAPAAAMPYLSDRPAKITVTLSSRLIHEQIVNQNGLGEERWQSGRTIYTKRPEMPWTVNEPSSNGTRDSGYAPFPASGFRDLDWVSESTYAGTTLFENNKCLVFIAAEKARLSPKPEAQKRQMETANIIVCIDEKTRFPVYQRINGEVRRFVYNANPPASISLPADLAQAIKEGEEGRARLNASAPKPY